MDRPRVAVESLPAILGLLSLSALLLIPPPAAAGTQECRAKMASVAGSFAKRRVQLMARCADSGKCDRSRLAAKLARLKERSQRKLASACSNLSRADLGLGQTCPDPSGRCTQVLDSEQAIIDCVLCMVRETVDPLIRRLRGDPADVAETCGGCSATPCDDQFFCETRPGHCDDSTAAGVCLEVPSACPDIFEPVCGCDGVTYANNCVRQQARAALFHPGPCVTYCDGTSGGSCPDGTVCVGLPGHCDETTDEGICVPIPADCAATDMPLCGCDGVTYANECELLAAGVRLDHFGPCEQTMCTNAPAGGEQCSPGFFCELPPEVCDGHESQGVCLPIPETCGPEQEPVCGCDGVTYNNNCERRKSGVALFHPGECQQMCGGITGEPCDTGQYCDLPPGLCGGADLQGHCVEVPPSCPDLLEPVCGCDGHTYINDCERLLAGVQVDHFGPCLSSCDPSNPVACDQGEVCVTPPLHCDAIDAAVCVPQPPECPPMTLEVCGCDGITYTSPCQAVQAGVGIAHEGAC